MDVRQIGPRNILFSFYDLAIPTNVASIVTEDNFFIIDSYLGEEPMEMVKGYLEDSYGEKDYVLINTHSDWDHVWGNSSFEEDLIISHSKCYEDMLETGESYLDTYSSYQRARVRLVYPNLTFTDSLDFQASGIGLRYTKGHSDDSISIIDFQDRIVYVGDNLERPYPHIQSRDLDSYIKTLEYYLDLGIEKLVGGHTGLEGLDLVGENLDYLRKIKRGEEPRLYSEEARETHRTNMEFLREKD